MIAQNKELVNVNIRINNKKREKAERMNERSKKKRKINSIFD